MPLPALLTILLQPLRRTCWLGLLLTAAAHAADEDDGQTLPAADSTEESAAASPPPPARVLPDSERQRHQGVSDYLNLHNRQQEMVALVTEETRFYGLFLQETTGVPQGGVLILHDNGQHGHWPQLVAPLRESLPGNGWATLSIELPDSPQQPLPPRPQYTAPATDEDTAADEDTTDDNAATSTAAASTTSDEQADNAGPSLSSDAGDDDENSAADGAAGQEPALPRLTTLPPLPDPAQQTEPAAEPGQEDAAGIYRRQMLGRIRAAVAYLNQRGQLNIVIIATGNSASWATAFMLERPRTVTRNTNNADTEDRGYTLVMIDASDSRYSQVPLDQQLSGLSIPVLDLISPLGISAESDIRRRAGSMRHKQRNQYQQIAVPAFALQYDDSNLLVRRVRGWLRSHAAGMELKNGSGS